MAFDGGEVEGMFGNSSNYIDAIGLPAADFAAGDDTIYGDDYNADYDPEEKAIVSYLPKPFALLSLICSYVVLRELWGEDQRGRSTRVGGTPINRMLMGMSFGDIIFSFAYFLGTWMAPPEGAYGIEGHGNVGTCTFQGFMIEFGLLGSFLSSAGLSIFYYLMICQNWADFSLEGIEIWMHFGIWFIALGLAIYPIPLQLYNSNGSVCWVDSSPPDCSGDDCVRGSNPWPHQLVIVLIPLVCVLVSLVNMGRIMCKVRHLENQASRYAGSITTTSRRFSVRNSTTMMDTSANVQRERGLSENSARSNTNVRVSGISAASSPSIRPGRGSAGSSSTVHRRKSNAVAKQALLYSLAFLTTCILDLVASFLYYAFDTYNAALEYLAYCVLMPSLGTFNFVIFARAREMKTCEGRLLRQLFFCLCWNCQSLLSTMRFRRRRRAAPHSTDPVETITELPPVEEGVGDVEAAADCHEVHEGEHDVRGVEDGDMEDNPQLAGAGGEKDGNLHMASVHSQSNEEFA